MNRATICDVEQFDHKQPEKHGIMSLCESETQGSTQGQSSMCLLILQQGSQFDALLSERPSVSPHINQTNSVTEHCIIPV